MNDGSILRGLEALLSDARAKVSLIKTEVESNVELCDKMLEDKSLTNEQRDAITIISAHTRYALETLNEIEDRP
jgi:hypothetical protein